MKRKLLLAAVVLTFLSLPCLADPLYVTFILDTSTATRHSCVGCGSFGTITITKQAANSVLVTETLSSGVGFVKTGAGDALDFSIAGDPSITISSLTPGFVQASSPANKGDTGTFDYGILCLTACGKGGSSPYFGELNCTVTSAGALSPSSFEVLNNKNFYVASDVIGLASGKTGNVESKSITAVPEPSTLAMIGVGFVGIAGALRRKLRL